MATSIKKATKKTGALSIAFLFDDTLDNDAGVAQYVKGVGSWLADKGHHITYIVGESYRSRPEGQIFSAAKNISIRWAGNRLSMPIWPKHHLIKQLIDKNDFDILHVMMPYSPLMSQYVIKRVPDSCAVVGSIHIFPSGPISEVGSRLLKLWYGRSFSRIDKYLSVSPAAASYGRSNWHVDSVISPNIVNIEKYRVRKPKPQDNRIVFLGRLVPRKGCAELIKAISHIYRNSTQEFQLIIAGDGPQRKTLENLCRRLKLNHRVKFLGYVDENKKAELLASAKIACFPSLGAESFGIVLIEAMAAGANVVLGGDNPGYRTVLGDKPELLVDPFDTVEFARRLLQLLNDRAKTKQLHDWQQAVVRQYDIAVVGPQLLKIYYQAIAKRRRKL